MNLILYYHLRPGFPSGSSLTSPHQNPLLSTLRATCTAKICKYIMIDAYRFKHASGRMQTAENQRCVEVSKVLRTGFMFE